MADTVKLVVGMTLGLAVAFAVLYGLSRLVQERFNRRAQGFADLARSHELQYAETAPSLAGRWSGPPFDLGETRSITNAISGTWAAREVVAFDLATSTRDPGDVGDGYRQRDHAVWAMRMPGPLPALQVTREGITADSADFGLYDLAADAGLTSAVNAFGREDLAMSHKQFDRHFRVQAPDPALATAVLHPQMIELLLARCTVAWRFDQDMLISWQETTQTTERVPPQLDLLRQIIDLIPPTLWHGHGRDRPEFG